MTKRKLTADDIRQIREYCEYKDLSEEDLKLFIGDLIHDLGLADANFKQLHDEAEAEVHRMESIVVEIELSHKETLAEVERLRGLLSRSLELLYPHTENLDESLAIVNIPIDKLAGFCREAQAALEEPSL